MNESFRQIKIDPPLPCVYHDCDGQATVAIAYAVSEREWRMVPTCERHTVLIPMRNESWIDATRHDRDEAERGQVNNGHNKEYRPRGARS